MRRLAFLQLLVGALLVPKAAAADIEGVDCKDPEPEIRQLRRRLRALRRRIRARLVEASEEDHCGAPNDWADGYRQCGLELVDWFDRGMPRADR